MPVTNYYTVDGEILGEQTTGSSRIDYLTDALGNVTATVNASGQVVNTYKYKPYGALLQKTGSGSDPSFQWVGSQGYRQTGKKYSDVYVRARHYDSLNGRWTTKDPIGFMGGDLDQYRYVRNRPAVWTDLTGLVCPPNCCDQENDWYHTPVAIALCPGSGPSGGWTTSLSRHTHASCKLP